MFPRNIFLLKSQLTADFDTSVIPAIMKKIQFKYVTILCNLKQYMTVDKKFLHKYTFYSFNL